jgi:uncharacterized protein YggE
MVFGCTVENKTQSVVSVFGVGTVSAKPDMVQINIGLRKTKETTKQAQGEVNVLIGQVLTILKDEGIEDKNIATASLRFNPEYEWRDGKNVLKGQTAYQEIAFSIHNINSDPEKASKIIDRLILINGIELHQFNFSVKDNTGFYAQSRELAYQKAYEKAEQYAALSGLKIVNTLRIAEEGSPQISPMNNVLQKAAPAADYGAAKLPVGELEITTKILAEFMLK